MPLRTLAPDTALLFITRIARMFAYGFLSVVLALYLAEIGFDAAQIGALFTLALIGDAVISLWLTTSADRFGRQRTLIVGAALMLFAGMAFAFTKNFFILAIAAIIGVISPSGNEIGPFLSIEQASLSQIIRDEQRTRIFAWYNLVGSFATALGALCGGGLVQALQGAGAPAVESYRTIVIAYAAMGAALALLFTRLSAAIQPRVISDPSLKTRLGLHRSQSVVLKLSALFALDAFAGGFVIQSLLAYWFYTQYKVDPGMLGAIFFGANIFAGISSLAAARIAAKFGLINTMVFTHIPSNILLILVPLMPNLGLAIALLLARFSISQMDVPTRQSYTMAVVAPDERSAASGITTIARSVGAALSPSLAGVLLSTPFLAAPFFIAGGLKIVYDLALYRSFITMKPPEEETNTSLGAKRSNLSK
ncbi:MAG: MFS transporter [Chloroflexi bacterium]|nr:MFS transporter [Chloroflexota bacterium]